MSALCLDSALGASPEMLAWVAVIVVGGFVLTLLALLVGLLWIHRRRDHRRLRAVHSSVASGAMSPNEARAGDPRYDPKQFRGKR